jgi:phage terminase Nu1 subunit (DNA packaging protein)
MATNKEVAEHLDCSPEWVSRLKSQNILPSAPGKSMSLDQCRVAYINYLRTKARMTSNTDDGTITEHKTRLTSAQADKAEMEVQVLSSSLIKADDVRTTWTEFVSNVRAKLLNLPAKLAHQVIGLDHYAEAEELLTNEIYETLNELSKSEYTESNEMGMDGNSEDVSTAQEATG